MKDKIWSVADDNDHALHEPQVRVDFLQAQLEYFDDEAAEAAIAKHQAPGA